jgi:Family of unknown function (DUF6510)
MKVQDSQYDPGLRLMKDGNAVAGLLQEVFGVEMTDNQAQCATCGAVSLIGELLVFGGTMGSVLRCPKCQEMMMRIVSRHNDLWLDMQGISYMRKERVTL